MKNITFLIPVYNDWESFSKLLDEINKILKDVKNFSFNLIVVNDGSNSKYTKKNIPDFLEKIEILNMKENKGHAICLAHGINHAIKNYEFDYLILMDADGEDRPIEILDLIARATELKETSIVAKRVKRSEGILFKIFYIAHKILTLIFTGKMMNFGNYSIITKKDAKKISEDSNLNSNYSGTLKNNIKNLGHINCERGTRYFGPSKMPLFKLILHSFSIIAVFKMNVFVRSALFIVLLTYLYNYLPLLAPILQLLIVIFNIIIYFISLKSSRITFEEISKGQESSETITH